MQDSLLPQVKAGKYPALEVSYPDDKEHRTGQRQPGDPSQAYVELGGAPEADREALTRRFLAEAKTAGLEGLKGHRSVGGLRASIYNAFPIEGVKALVEFMAEFERTA